MLATRMLQLSSVPILFFNDHRKVKTCKTDKESTLKPQPGLCFIRGTAAVSHGRLCEGCIFLFLLSCCASGIPEGFHDLIPLRSHRGASLHYKGSASEYEHLRFLERSVVFNGTFFSLASTLVNSIQFRLKPVPFSGLVFDIGNTSKCCYLSVSPRPSCTVILRLYLSSRVNHSKCSPCFLHLHPNSGGKASLLHSSQGAATETCRLYSILSVVHWQVQCCSAIGPSSAPFLLLQMLHPRPHRASQ